MPVLVATDIAARGLDIDQLPHVVNFELPNVAEDYVHRIGRTGRAGSSGAAISLVDKEESQFLRDIERLIKREIPVVAVDSFVPPENLPAEAPRPPRQPHGQRRGGAASGRPASGRSASGTGPARPARSGNTTTRDNHNQPPRGGHSKPRNPQQREHLPGQGVGKVPENGQQVNKPRQPHQPQKPASQQHLSEAARHQSMPQPALFSPKVQPVV